MKIVLINTKFSSSLEDGVTAECLEYALRARLPGVTIVNCDLDGQREYGRYSGLLAKLTNNLLPITQDAVKTPVYLRLYEAMVRAKLLPHYDKTINGADVAVFGAGLLFTDKNLRMPMKIAAAASVIRDRDLPIAIHAVGVSDDWSTNGAALFKEAFLGADVIWASVGDEVSGKHWRRQFGAANRPTPFVSMDPAILAAKTYASAGHDTARRRNRPVIGVSITHPSTLVTQSDQGGAEQIAPNVNFYRQCVDALAAKECDILVFSNGAPEEESYLRRCFTPGYLGKFPEGQVDIEPPGKTPEDLVKTIRNCDALLSHRLNACIVAYSCQIPHVGLTLNSSLDAFFENVGRKDFILSPRISRPDAIADAVFAAADSPIDNAKHTAITKQADHELDALASKFAPFGKNAPQQIAVAR